MVASGLPEAKDGMLGKGLNLLLALGEHPEGAGVSRLAATVGVPASTAHRLLNSMIPAGFVTFDDDTRQYSLGLRVFELSHRVSLVQDLGALALPVMRSLTELSGEQTLMSVRRDLELVYLEKVEGRHQLQNNAPVGGRGFLHCSSMGKSLLAWLPDEEMEAIVRRLKLERRTPNTITEPRRLVEDLRLSRERGFTINEEENEIGVRSVAVPVLDPRGRPACAICLTAPVFRCTREVLDGYVPLLKELTTEIGFRLPRGGASNHGQGGLKT
jgi:DNA-binding IclR family transcriptional regulator